MNVALVSFVSLHSKDFKRNDPKRDCFWDIPELFDPARKCWTLDSGRWTLDTRPENFNFKLVKALETMKILILLGFFTDENFWSLQV